MTRNRAIDVFRGLLILLVVIGHSDTGIIHDFIYLFHMPLFFVLSGILLIKEKLLDYEYIKVKSITLLIPYCIYLLLDIFCIRQIYTPNIIICILWGGRTIPGVYWYITCFIIALVFFSMLLNHFSDRMIKIIVIVGAGIAVIESHLAEYVQFLKYPGIPWNADVMLMATLYISIGYYHKKIIIECMSNEGKKYDYVAGGAVIALLVFCVNNYNVEIPFYYFDMKPIYYKEVFMAIIIPCAFGVVICRIVYWLSKNIYLKSVQAFLSLCGRMTIPIMFMHVPINIWQKTYGYGRVIYMILGIGVPTLFTIIFGRFKIMRKLFGLPKLSEFIKKK